MNYKTHEEWESDKRWHNTKMAMIGAAIAIILGIISLLIFCKSAHAAEVDTTRAVIHHTESPAWTTVADIDRWHKERGWDGIGYHFVIYADGSVHAGRDLHKRGAHARGRNDRVGIALVGYDKFTAVQIVSLKKLLNNLGVRSIERHHERCPGPGVNLEGLLVRQRKG